MEIKIDGSLTKEEFLRSVKLVNRPITKRTQFRFDLWILILLVGLAAVGLSIWGMTINRDYYPLEFIGFVIGLALAIFGLKLRTAISQLWDKNEALRAHREGLATDEYIELKTQTIQSRYQWSGFSGYGEYEEVVVLFLQGAAQAMTFSRRFFQSDTDWLQFKSLVEAKLPLTHRIKPVNRGDIFIWLLILISVIAIVVNLFMKPK
jgi:hypothetical protein